MQFNNKEILELSNDELKNAHANCNKILDDRKLASEHEKFKKMPFPPPNPKFIEMKNEIENEIKKRKL